MTNYIFKSIKKHKKQFIFMLITFFSIMSVVPLALSALYTSKALIKEDIEKYSRGEYDILVRNESEISDIEKRRELVEENYLASGKGGITLEQYEKIKNLPGIDAAAPVSAIGYFTSHNNTLNVRFPYEKSYHMKLDVITYDGVKNYVISSKDYYQIASDYEEGELKGLPRVFFPKSVQMFSNARGEIDFPIFLPETWDLVVAIDPEEEAKLTGIHQNIVTGRYLDTNDKINKVEIYPNEKISANQIPIVINEGAVMPVKLRIQFDDYGINREMGKRILENISPEMKNSSWFQIDYDDNDSKENIEKIKHYRESLSNLNPSRTTTRMIDITPYIKPFFQTEMVLSDDGGDIRMRGNESGYTRLQGSEYYKASPIEYRGDIDMVEAVPSNEKDGLLTFRNMFKVGKSVDSLNSEGGNKEILIDFREIGRVEFNEGEREKITGSPLGIYGESHVYQVEDESGEKIENRKLYPTINPGSFVPSAPHGYTTLDAAKIYKGDSPIDAIRIRVAGITQYNKDAQNKIERIAKEISNITGLHVDIVAGSSTRQILVSIPGLSNTSGLGKVLERWTSLGTAVTITNTWNKIGLILVVLYIIGGILFILNRINSSLSSRKREIGILKSLGWSASKIAQIICSENTLAAFGASILSALLMVLINFFYDINYIGILTLAALFIFMIIVICISYLYSLLEQRKITVSHIYSGDVARKNSHRITTLFKMILNNVWSYKRKSFLLVLQIALSGGLGVFTWLSIEATRKIVGYTALGRYINLTTEEMSQVLIIGSLMLVVFTMFDRFSTIVLERKREIGILRTLGWRNLDVIKVIFGEALLLALTGALFAASLSLGSYVLIYSSFPVSVFRILLVFIGLISVSIIPIIYPLHLAVGVTPIETIMEWDM